MVVGNIDTKDISVVVQGAIDQKYTADCLKSIRKYLPGSEIILSTWEGSNVNRLDYDILVISEDPGANMHNTILKAHNNVNRQLLSTQNGIKKSKKRYILKTRTDSILINNNFLNYFDKYNIRDKQFKIFENRVIVSSIYSREYSHLTKLPLHFLVSDFYFFGLKKDIEDYFLNTNLELNSNTHQYNHKFKNLYPYPNDYWKYIPEQYYCISWLKKHGYNNIFEDFTDISYEAHILSINILYNNFIFLELEQSGIGNQKHVWAFDNPGMLNEIITFDLFNFRYNQLKNGQLNNMSQEMFWINNIYGYLNTHLLNNINNRFNIIESKINENNIIINRKKLNIVNLILDFLFSIELLENKNIIRIFGIKITLKK